MFEAEKSWREKEIFTKGVGDREKKCVRVGKGASNQRVFLT